MQMELIHVTRKMDNVFVNLMWLEPNVICAKMTSMDLSQIVKVSILKNIEIQSRRDSVLTRFDVEDIQFLKRLFFIPPSAFLHEWDDGGAEVVVVVLVGVLDGDAELRVGGERVEVVAAPARRLPGDPGALELGHLPLRTVAAESCKDIFLTSNWAVF